jgi:hypothetical protein
MKSRMALVRERSGDLTLGAVKITRVRKPVGRLGRGLWPRPIWYVAVGANGLVGSGATPKMAAWSLRASTPAQRARGHGSRVNSAISSCATRSRADLRSPGQPLFRGAPGTDIELRRAADISVFQRLGDESGSAALAGPGVFPLLVLGGKLLRVVVAVSGREDDPGHQQRHSDDDANHRDRRVRRARTRRGVDQPIERARENRGRNAEPDQRCAVVALLRWRRSLRCCRLVSVRRAVGNGVTGLRAGALLPTSRRATARGCPALVDHPKSSRVNAPALRAGSPRSLRARTNSLRPRHSVPQRRGEPIHRTT